MNVQHVEESHTLASHDTPDVVVTLTTHLDRSLRMLGDAGLPVEASRLAARAWSDIRHDHPEQAERLNRTLHYLARREAELAGRPPT